MTAAGPQFGPPGYEINVLYLAGLWALAVAAPTPWSLDRWRLGTHVSTRARHRTIERPQQSTREVFRTNAVEASQMSTPSFSV
jgi:hypothetical protein